MKSQSGILANLTMQSRYLTFSVADSTNLKACLADLVKDARDNRVVGIGQSLVQALGKRVPGLDVFPALSANGIDIPSTPSALWCWLKGTDRGELYHESRELMALLEPAFVLDDVIDAFKFKDSRDLSGYEDGTENPVGDDAVASAIVTGQGKGLDGSSFVAVQQWLHDLDVMSAMDDAQRDDLIGRHIADNEEFDEAPASAHVKRSAQESFEPEAFMLRRSMPWTEGTQAGLMFIAFGHSFYAYNTIMKHMVGSDDGVVDGLFTFTRPVTGAYYWCPPVSNGELDLSLLGISD